MAHEGMRAVLAVLLAWPSIFIVARDGTVVQRWLADTYKERIGTADVLRELHPK